MVSRLFVYPDLHDAVVDAALTGAMPVGYLVYWLSCLLVIIYSLQDSVVHV